MTPLLSAIMLMMTCGVPSKCAAHFPNLPFISPGPPEFQIYRLERIDLAKPVQFPLSSSMPTNDEILRLDLSTLDHDNLLDTARSLQRRALSIPISTTSTSSSLESRSNWFRAERDSPEDLSWSCFANRYRHSNVIVYDQSRSSHLETRSTESLKGKLTPPTPREVEN
jgi:hypothetical protein